MTKMLRKALYTQVKYIKTKHENLIAIFSPSIVKTSMIFLWNAPYIFFKTKSDFDVNHDGNAGVALLSRKVKTGHETVFSRSWDANWNSTEQSKFVTGHVIYNPAYTYKFQLKTTVFMLPYNTYIQEVMYNYHFITINMFDQFVYYSFSRYV